MVVSGDRDAYQLVGDGVRVMSTSRGVTDTKIYDREGVIERYGVPPELVPDLIGLKGDTSDNIPGVPGIGEKTASQLLQEFGSLEAVLDNVDEISGPKRKQNLTEHADDARISKQLATMHYDIDDRARPRRADGARPRPLAGCASSRPSSSCAQVIQRLEDEWERRGARAAPSTRTIEVEAERGRRSPTSPTGEIALRARAGGPLGRLRRRAPDRRRRARSPPRCAASSERQPAGRPRRQVARRPRPRGLLAAAGAGSLDLAPRHDDRRLPDRPGAADLRARRARRRRGPLGRRRDAERGRRRAARRSGEEPEAAGRRTRPTTARLAWELAARQRREARASSGSSA